MLVKQIIVSALCWLLLSVSSFAQSSYSDIIVFGDSLSDTGNVVGAITPDLIPPYADNRISNGPLIVDVVAEQLGFDALAAAQGGNNFAVVGGNILGASFGDLSQQIDRFEMRQQGVFDASALYIVFMGGNDLRDVIGFESAAFAEQRIDQVITVLINQLTRLRGFGAQHFLVVNGPDVSTIPQTISRAESNPDLLVRASAYVQSYNQKFESAITQFVADTDASVFDFDIVGSARAILEQPNASGFTVLDRACLNTNGSINPFDFTFDAGCDSGLYPIVQPDFTGYVFFDNIHLTAAMNALLADAMLARLQGAPLRVSAESSLNLSGVLLLLLDDEL